MPNAVPISRPDPGTGYNDVQGRFINARSVVMLPAQTLAAGVTVGPVFEVAGAHTLALKAAVTAQSGTAPTLALTVQTSVDGSNDWRTVGTFATKSASAAAPNDGLAMSAVVSAGTTPPVVTLTGVQTQPINLQVKATLGGALGTWTGTYSIDGGATTVAFTSAATVEIVDANGTDTGVALNIAAGTAATDNVWTATTVGYERKAFTGLDRYARIVASVGGTATPTMTAYVNGRVVGG